jgi:iron(III) transport system ATP-binding protein
MNDLRLDNVTFIYDSRKCDGLDRINFELQAGQLCAILGPSGSGKTTLLKLIAGELKPHKGSIIYGANKNVALYLPFESTAHIAQQEITLLQYLMQDSINANEDLIRDQISFLELSDEFYSPLKSLSLGQWHRAQLAKFFFTDATLLLLDEPFIHLDPSRRQFIAQSLLRLAKENNKIVCWSTHFLEDGLMLADKILILQHGVQQQFSASQEAYWQPNNLFVAQYFGDNNLLMAIPNHQEKYVFDTALGKISYPIESSKEVILMCRPHLCRVHIEEPASNIGRDSKYWKMILKKISFFGAFQRLEFYHQQRSWWVDLSTSPWRENVTPTPYSSSFLLDEEYWIEVPNSAWSILKSY